MLRWMDVKNQKCCGLKMRNRKEKAAESPINEARLVDLVGDLFEMGNMHYFCLTSGLKLSFLKSLLFLLALVTGNSHTSGEIDVLE